MKRLTTKLAALVCGVLLLLFAPRARAEQVTIHFETYGELAPGDVCVVTQWSTFTAEDVPLDQAFAPVGARAKPESCDPSWRERLSTAAKEFLFEPATPAKEQSQKQQPSQAAASAKPADAGAGFRPLHMFCHKNSYGATNGKRVVLLVYRAVLTEFNLANGVVTLQLNPDKNQKGSTQLELVGRHYQAHSALPLRLRDSTQIVTIPLVPLCVQRELALPDNVCEQKPSPRSRYKKDSTAWIPDGVAEFKPDQSRATLTIATNSKKTVTLKRCKHAFVTTWTESVPPHRLELSTDRFTFGWKTNCLSPPDACPSAVLPGANVSCTASRYPTDGECQYTCRGAARFPVQVQLSFPDPDGTLARVWNESLDTPGQLLLGYIPESQRRIGLDWRWQPVKNPDSGECKNLEPEEAARCERAKGVTGDHIDYTEIKTPEGTVHRVHFAANQLRIPELDCKDFISYRYVGTRAFQEHVVGVDRQGGVTLEDPSKFRADNFALGAGLGGGARYIQGTGRSRWGPQAEVQAIALFRSFREWVKGVDLELRVGAIWARQPYCARNANSSNGTQCGDEDWERLPYWHFPFMLGFNWQFSNRLPLSVGAGAGASFTSYFFARDSPKLRTPWLFAGRVHFGYRATRSMSIEPYLRFMGGEQPVETVFDDAGVQRQGPISDASSWAFYPGLLLRVDDVF